MVIALVVENLVHYQLVLVVSVVLEVVAIPMNQEYMDESDDHWLID